MSKEDKARKKAREQAARVSSHEISVSNALKAFMFIVFITAATVGFLITPFAAVLKRLQGAVPARK